MRQQLAGLKRLGAARKEPTRKISIASGTGIFVPMEIDVRGERVADVEDQLERYLDNAYRANLPSVRIIHGKGTGRCDKRFDASFRRIQALRAVNQEGTEKAAMG